MPLISNWGGGGGEGGGGEGVTCMYQTCLFHLGIAAVITVYVNKINKADCQIEI